MRTKKRRPPIGQGQLLADEIWILIDEDNGDASSKRYLWWFESRQKAREHKKWQNANPKNARVTGPFRYRLRRP